jgi:carbon-monoxide dehydrogenase small subunit
VVAPSGGVPQGTGVNQSLRIGLPADVVWAAVQDPGFVAGCVPGARVTRVDGDRIDGEMVASLGPIQARFTGQARVTFDQASRGGLIVGEGRDAGGGTRLSGEATFAVLPDGSGATLIRVDISYSLRGALAQFGRGPVVQVFAAEIAAEVARNLEARLRGGAVPARLSRLSAGGLFLRVLWRALRRWMGHNA